MADKTLTVAQAVLLEHIREAGHEGLVVITDADKANALRLFELALIYESTGVNVRWQGANRFCMVYAVEDA